MVTWVYDTLGRPITVQKFQATAGQLEDSCGQVQFLYDRQSLDTTFAGSNLAARVAVHYRIDWNYDEDRSQIRTGFGPEDITRLRRFAEGNLKSLQKPAQSTAEMIRKLAFRTRLVFDYLPMTKTSIPREFAR